MKTSLIAGVVSATLLFGASNVFASDSNAHKAQYRAVLKNELSKNEPGAVALISKEGEVIFKKAIGSANLELKVPLKAKNVFKIGSISKQFTAAAIMILQERGKLSVHDDIHKYVPDFPTEGHVITIEQLLTHTSGLANYTEDRELMLKEIQAPATLDEMLARFAAHPMKFQPGDAMAYSNTGYVLLGKIIEVVSGQSYAEFIDEHIFDKLDMKNSHYAGRQIIKRHVSGYDLSPEGYVNAGYIDMIWPHAAGALSSNVFDLNIWFTALANGSLISEQSYQQMIAPVTLNDGRVSNYGYGLATTTIGEYQAIGHAGGIHGFVSDAVYVPEEELYITVLANSTNRNPQVLTQRLAAKALGLKSPSYKEVNLTPQQLQAFEGEYQFESGAVRRIVYYEGDLYTQEEDGYIAQLSASSSDTLFFDQSTAYMSFVTNEQGNLVMNLFENFSDEPRKAVKK
ncbi:serine hydrolase domain-containing protein [Pseudoalteromonas luteoviolacea]|uniref:serine hydrolase domain-containing protein n=1 Tax=Pseudoalteromonas luteoviolacea TaxID=43657 RepID=UPI00163B8F1E|nr:serine hydrolase domain-containing protein [Pseudoalteromonas luteoviolacea]